MEKLCILVPYRDREAHLQEFYPAMVAYLGQRIDYEIIVVEQTFAKPFNRGKLLNAGFQYTEGAYDYYCFHDVDMLPLEVDYSYCSNPTHIAVEVEVMQYHLPYENYFGGVTLFDKASFERINGFSNDYFGWGCEDDDLRARCMKRDVPISRRNCRFRSLSHPPMADQNLLNYNRLRLDNFESTFIDGEFISGLKSLQYKVLEREEMAPKMLRIKLEI